MSIESFFWHWERGTAGRAGGLVLLVMGLLVNPWAVFFFPLDGRPVLGVVVQFSPFYHGVRLLQLSAWGQWQPAAVAWHLGVLFAFTLVLGLWAHRRIDRKLTT